MKIIGLNILLALFCLACQHSACVINGTGMLSEQEGKQLYLQVLDNETMKPRILDSALVCGGKFRMELSSVLPQTAMLSIMENGKPAWGAQFILEDGQIHIALQADNTVTIAGTPNNDLLQQHLTRWYVPMNKMQANNRQMGLLRGDTEQERAALDSLDKQNRAYLREMRLLSLEFVKENVNNQAGQSLLMEIMGLPDRLLVDVVERANAETLRLPLMQQIVERVNIFKAAAIGQPFPDFTGEDLQGKQIRLSDCVKGKEYVLLDFWASWCKPCCEEMPSLKKLYRDYRAKGLEIVGISIDEDKKAWQQKVGDLGMNWIQLRDASREAVKKYVIGPIPHTVLIDPSGKIIAKDLRGQELENKIIECLK